jgi:hypothetical protein
VEFAADVGEVSRKLLPRAPLAEDRLRVPKKCCIIMDCADKNLREPLLSLYCRSIISMPLRAKQNAPALNKRQAPQKNQMVDLSAVHCHQFIKR